jgi:hypothetical protein
MNPNLCRVVLRPRGPLEVFDLGLRMVGSNGRPMLTLAAATVVPVWLPLAVFAWWLPDQGWLAAFLAVVVGVPVQLPFTLLGGRLLFSDTVSVREVLRAWLGLIAPTIGVWFLYGAALVIGMLFCGWGVLFTLVPALYLAETTVLERVPMERGLRRSSRLASAHPGTAGAGALGWLGLTVWFALVGEYGMQALLGTVLQLGNPFGTLLGGAVTPGLLLGLLAAQPAIAIYRLLLYVDVRTRVEGWDLQVRLRAAGLGP